MKRVPGLFPSPADERDYPLRAVAEEVEKPDFASLRQYILRVLDQRDTPTCAAHAICAAFEAIYRIKFSIRWAYWKAKEIDGIDTPGTTFRAILQVATKQGLCPEDFCPSWPNWDDRDFTPEMAKEASKYRLKAYARLQVGTLEEIEKAIASGLFVLLGTLVTKDNWLDDDEFITEPSGKILGAHATLGVEYDENFTLRDMKDFVTLLNSWGTDKGDGGYYKMAEHYAQWKSDLGMPALMEAWAITFDKQLIPKVEKGDKPVVGIDPGHGGKDTGAIGLTGAKEKDVNLGIALALKQALERNGIGVVMTRETDKDMTLTERSNLFNAKGVDLAVSVHCNGATDPRADYIATYIVGKGGKAEIAATLVQRELANATKWPDHGIIIENFHMLRETKMPAVLTECGFITNPAQEASLKQKEFQAKLAEAHAKGICMFFGKLYIDPEIIVECDVPPTIINGRTMLEVRTLIEDICGGKVVSFDNMTKTGIYRVGDKIVTIQIGNPKIKVEVY